MNSKGFKNFSKGFSNPGNMKGSDPRALLPVLLFGGLAYLMKDCIYYGINPFYLS